MDEPATTVIVQRYLDALAANAPAEQAVRALLDRAVNRLRQARVAAVQQRGAQQVQPADGPVQQGPDNRLGG